MIYHTEFNRSFFLLDYEYSNHHLPKNTMTYVVEYPGPGMGEGQKCGGLDRLIESQYPIYL